MTAVQADTAPAAEGTLPTEPGAEDQPPAERPPDNNDPSHLKESELVVQNGCEPTAQEMEPSDQPPVESVPAMAQPPDEGEAPAQPAGEKISGDEGKSPEERSEEPKQPSDKENDAEPTELNGSPPDGTPSRASPPRPPPPAPPSAPPPPPPSSAPSSPANKKHPRNWWGHSSVRSPRGSRSQSREGSPLNGDPHGKRSPRSPTKTIADLLLSAMVHAAGGKAGGKPRPHVHAAPDKQDPAPPPAAQPAVVREPAPAESEDVPNITFTFFDPKEAAKAAKPKDADEDEATPDSEWEDDVQRDKEVTETVVAPQRASMLSDADEEFVDARESSASSPTNSLSPSPAPAPPKDQYEEPEYVCVERRPHPAKVEPRSAVVNPIYRSPSYSSAVEEGLYSCPRPHTAPPPPPPGSPPAPPKAKPPPVPEPDWTSTDSSSNQVTEYTTYYATPNGEPASLPPEIREYEELEYCSLRASQRGRRPKSVAADAADAAPGNRVGLLRVQRVRSRLGKAWRSVRGWWDDERGRLNETFMRHVHAQAVGAFDAPPPPPPCARSCDTLAGHDDFDDDDEEVAAATAAAEKAEKSEKADKEEHVGLFKRAISAPTIPRVLVLRRRKDSDEASSASYSTWGRGSRASMARPGSALRRSKYMPEGQNGFEELRRYIKQGGDFCKDLTSILQERAEAEQVYAKSLAKLSSKLLKASKDSVGSVGQAWQRIGTEMECQGEIHRTFAVALSEEVVKPLKQLVDSQHRIRKSVESSVDKTAKSLSEWRQAEAKSKKTSFMCARDNEKLQDAMVEGRQSTRGSSLHLHHAVHNKMSEKDVAKLETKRRKAEDSVKKADVEYYTFCIRAERARLEWETAVLRGSYCLQAIEEERLQNLKELGSMYLRHLKEMGPKMVQSTDRLNEPVQNCDVATDIQTVVSLKGTGQPPSEQLLPDFYAEHVTLGMNRDRRKQALVKVMQLIKQDLERERRSKQGVENLARALQQTPNFGAEDSQQNVTEKLHHMRAMLTYLEAARYKVQSVLAELEGRPNQAHPLSSHIIVHRDRQGLQQSILKVPPWVRKDSLDQMNGDSPDWMDRGAADGNSVQPDSDFDEFSSQGSEKDFNGSLIISECASTTQASNNPSVGTCRALYQYAANLYDELNLNPGDVINIHDKQDDGWWLGELNGTVGIFPATYVEEIK